MELYFEKPALVRIFYYKNPKDFSCIHVHDVDLKLQRRNVIYLYRHPVPTIYSQMNYYQENLEDEERLTYWADLYGNHLSKWLFKEEFTNKKTIITYENLKDDFHTEFKKICNHFGEEYNKERLEKVRLKVSKEKIKEKVTDDSQVVNIRPNYEQNRKEFERNFGKFILQKLDDVDRRVITLF